MEHTRNKLTSFETIFFNRLSNYLDTKLYFFGSVQRNDYLPKYSDIDVDIFTENENSTIIKMMHLLDVEKSEFKKFIWKLNVNNKLITGYKLLCKTKENNIIVEFSIHNQKYKKEILKEHVDKTDIPFYATYLLIFIKYLYYKFNIIPSSVYRNIKKFILTYIIGKKFDHFLVLDIKKHNKEIL